ncbi:MAG: M43 family zinc metalloprotease [Bacteroidota bacterium]
MKKNYFLLLCALAGFTGQSFGQHKCATTEMHQEYKRRDPRVADYEKQLQEDTKRFIEKHKISKSSLGKTTWAAHNDTDYYDIPMVVHIMHSYANDNVADTTIYRLIKNLNIVFNAQNPDLAGVIAPFKPYIGKAKFRFHLATIDPTGQPTTGITRRFSYLANGGDDQVKMDQWSPTNYLNLWVETKIGRGTAGGTVLAYATLPSGSASFPFYDGVISDYNFLNQDNTIQHEIGHYLNLYHPWNSSGGDVGEACGDDDVDDTPPTKGHFSTCPLYDSSCATNYYKIYTRVTTGVADSLVNYPDTTNVQNIMDYSSCTNMFTKGQVVRMRASLNSNVAGRNNLWDSLNLIRTGIGNGLVDLKPVTDFIVRTTAAPSSAFSFFAFPGVNTYFFNRSWRDTVTKVDLTFSNGATPASTTLTGAAINANVPVKFTEPGWATVTMAATGNNSGTTTTTYNHSIFVADPNATDPNNYMQDFAPTGDVAKWPMFNYYNNEFKWEIANVGMYDGYSAKYKGFDDRINPFINQYPLTGTPVGDVDDLFSVPVNLSGFGSAPVYLNFFYSAASRSARSVDITDTLLIDYATGATASSVNPTWVNFKKIAKSELINRGVYSFPYTPTSVTDWSPRAIQVPELAKKAYTVFRFRYKPNVGEDDFSSGNNFYMDRVSFGSFPASVSNTTNANVDVAVVPNPTHGNAYVIVKDAENSIANVVVTDITGKVVFTASQQISGSAARFEIPQSAIPVTGMYLVQTTTGNQTNIQKLVVY